LSRCKRVVRFNDEASQLAGQQFEIAVSGSFGSEVRAQSLVEVGTVRIIQKWRFFKFLTEHIEQSRLMCREILFVDRDHGRPYSVEKDDPQPHTDT
jgi:hypothetical protein